MRRRPPLLRSVLISTAVLVVVSAAALLFPIDRVVVAEGRLGGGTSPVLASIDARVDRVLVAAGDVVRAGDPLLVLESTDIASARARVEARLAAQRERARAIEARIGHLLSTQHAAQTRQAELDVDRAQVRVRSAERKFNAVGRLLAERLVAELAHDEARAELELARVDLEQASLRREAVVPEQAALIEQLQITLREAQATLDEYALEAAELARREAAATIVASTGGTVVGTRLDELVGRRVLTGDELMRVSFGPADRFEGHVDDSGRVHVREGMNVRVRVAGYPWMLHGTVRGRVTLSGERTDAARGFPIDIHLSSDRRELRLRDGMGATARILIEEQVPLGELVFERLVEAR